VTPYVLDGPPPSAQIMNAMGIIGPQSGNFTIVVNDSSGLVSGYLISCRSAR
jgi:hypothetical protein